MLSDHFVAQVPDELRVAVRETMALVDAYIATHGKEAFLFGLMIQLAHAVPGTDPAGVQMFVPTPGNFDRVQFAVITQQERFHTSLATRGIVQ